MSKLLIALLVSAATVASTFPAQAGGYYHSRPYGYHGYQHHGYKSYTYKNYGHYRPRHHGHYSHRRHHHRHGHDYGDEILLGAGIIGGSIIIGSVLSQPRYAPPPPVYYYAPPPQPTCVQDQVYRYLPDGSIQWGTRTRCY
jgi:hypothetical protein